MAKNKLKDLDIKEDNDIEELKVESKGKKILKELIPYAIILVVVVIIRTFLVTPVIVQGESMKPTLDGGEMMILNKVSKYKRFSIVVVDIEDENLIKRIIALPGETISIENGVIFINDHRLEEEYGMGVIKNDYPRTVLKDDEYFVLGDNRENSKDSRIIGPVKNKQIKGVSEFILFPFSEFGRVK